MTGLLARLPLPVLLDLLGVLVGAVTVDVVVVVVEFEMAVVGAEVVVVEGVVLEDRLHLLYLVTPVANLRPVFYNVLKCFETLKSVANLRPVPPTPGPSASRHMRFF